MYTSDESSLSDPLFSDTLEINVLHRCLSNSNGGAETPRPVAQTPSGEGAAATPATLRGSDDNAPPLHIPFGQRVCRLLKDLAEDPYKTKHAEAD